MQSGAVCCCAQPSHVPQLTTTACPREGGRGGKVTAGVLCWGHFILQCCPMLGTKCKSVAVPDNLFVPYLLLLPQGSSPAHRPPLGLVTFCASSAANGAHLGGGAVMAQAAEANPRSCREPGCLSLTEHGAINSPEPRRAWLLLETVQHDSRLSYLASGLGRRQ